MTSYTHTIHISRAVYQKIESLAAATHQSVDALADETLERSLPPALEQVPPRFRTDLAQLAQMSDEMLWRMSKVELPAQRASVYEQLLIANSARALSPQEREQLDILREESDLLMFRRSYALLLLKSRGHHLPTLRDDE